MLRRTVVAAGLALLPGMAAANRLFDGGSLAGWRPIGDANWTVRDGAVMADQGTGFLVSEASFGDVRIDAEVWVSAEANSGVFIRCADPARITADNAYEINVFDQRPDPTYATGSIVNVAPAARVMLAGEHWNTLRIEARGDRLSVTFNGVATVDGVRDGRLARGPIALQRMAGVVKFRKVNARRI